MKRTNLILLAIFVLLGSLTVWYLLSKEDEKTTLAGADRRFAVEDVKKIQKIFLADRTGEQVLLERAGDHWIYNGEYKAKPSVVSGLREVIGQMQIKYKPPQAAVDEMIKSLATEGIKVEIYDRDDALIRSYYVGGATPDERGTYMMMADAEQPYVTYLPGWVGNLRFRFSLRGHEWRDLSVFAVQPEAVQSVSLEYPKQRNKSFRLERQEKGFRVEPFYDITPVIDKPVRPGRIESFLDGFRLIGGEAFQNNIPERDSIADLVPFVIIHLEKTNGEEVEVRLHPIVKKGNIDPKTGEPVANYEIERYHADVVSSGDFVMVQHRVFRKILWAYDFFFE